MANAITVKIDAYTKDFVKALDQGAEAIGRFSAEAESKLASAKQAFEDFEKKNENLAASLEKTATGAGIAFAALTATVLLSVSAFNEEELIVQKTAQTLANTGRAAEITAEQIGLLTDSLEETTVFGKEATQSGVNFILTLDKISSKSIPEVSKAALDLAAGIGGDVEGAFRSLGKALQDPVEGLGALGRAGVKFSNEQEAVIKTLVETGQQALAQKVILQEVETRFGNLSEVGVDSTKAFGELKEQFGNVVEEIGKQLAPAVIALSNSFKNFLITIKNNEGLIKVVALFIGVATAITGVVAGLALVGAAILKFGAILAGINALLGVTLTGVQILAGATGIGLLLVAIGLIYANWEAIFPRMLAIGTAFFQTITALFSSYGEILAGIFTLDPERIKKGLVAAKDAVLNVGESYNKALKEQEKERNTPDVAAATQAGYTEEESRQLGAAQAKVEADAARRAAEQSQAEIDKAEKLRLQQEEDQAQLDAKIAFNQISQETLLQQVRDGLGARSALELEADLKSLQNKKDYVAAVKRVKEEQQKIEENAMFATKKYEDMTQKERLEALKGTLNTIATLQSSSSEELFAVGKAAALATATIDGFAAVTGAYKVGAGLGGPALGGLFAAAAGAATAVQIAKIAGAKPPTGAADGALVGAGQYGVDNQPYMLAKGELVAPDRSFDEVVEGVARQRGFVKPEEASQSGRAPGEQAGGPNITVVIDQAVGMDSYINDLCEKIRDAVQFRNADLGAT